MTKNFISARLVTDMNCPICGNPIYQNTDLYSRKIKHRCKSCMITFPDNAIAKIKRKMAIRKKWIELSNV